MKKFIKKLFLKRERGGWILKDRKYKIIGSLIILIALVLNPFVVEYFFSPDKELDQGNLVKVIIFDMFLLCTGIITIKKKARKKSENWIKKITKTISHILKNKTIKKILLTTIITIIAIGFIESSFYQLNTHQRTITITRKADYRIMDENLGFRGIPNLIQNVLKMYDNGSIIYNVTYSIDEFGRRKNEHKEGPPLILFGGSFVFGAGLEDNETLNYYLTNFTKFDVYNYGLGGYGTHQMLTQLEQQNFTKEINKTGGKAIYIFIPDHIRRTIGDMYWSYRYQWKQPYYKLNKNNELQRKGSFKTGRPITTKIYKTLRKSNIIKYYNINLPPKRKTHTYLTYKIIEKSKEIYEEKFNGTFYVLIHPLITEKKESKELKKLLTENNINILEYNLPTKNYYEEYRISGDGHPNAKLNKKLAQKIAKTINTNG